MPLIKSAKPADVKHNIREMIHAGHPRDVAVAAALNTARRSHAEGGAEHFGIKKSGPAPRKIHPPGPDIEGPEGIPGIEPIHPVSGIGGNPHAEPGGLGPKTHTGAIRSEVAGRTDHLKVHVPSGSYVIPADIISAMGEGNTEAGFKVAKSIFAQPFYGTSKPGAAEPYDPNLMPYDAGAEPYSASGSPYDQPMPGKAEGGAHDQGAVPIVAAGGEMVVTPEQVMRLGDGDLDDGHKILDQFVLQMRKKTVKTLRNLPGPKTD